MYTIDLEAVLQMVEIKPHEELLADGALTLFDEHTGRAAFVSHQWVAKHHPDPDHKQFRTLQDALQSISSGVTQISVDVVTEIIFGKSPRITQSFDVADLHIWYDYFCCPQHELQGDPSQSQHGELAKAINSIPAYVAKCQVMFVLCPVIDSCDNTTTLSPSSWAGRGSQMLLVSALVFSCLSLQQIFGGPSCLAWQRQRSCGAKVGGAGSRGLSKNVLEMAPSSW